MARHPDTDLVPYLRGELPPAERERRFSGEWTALLLASA